jgi:hypothetical protein
LNADQNAELTLKKSNQRKIGVDISGGVTSGSEER